MQSLQQLLDKASSYGARFYTYSSQTCLLETFANSKQKTANGFEVTTPGMFLWIPWVYAHGLCTGFNQKHLYWQIQYFQNCWYLTSLPIPEETAEDRWSAQWWFIAGLLLIWQQIVVFARSSPACTTSLACFAGLWPERTHPISNPTGHVSRWVSPVYISQQKIASFLHWVLNFLDIVFWRATKKQLHSVRHSPSHPLKATAFSHTLLWHRREQQHNALLRSQW